MTISALKYHDSTSYDRQKMDGHYLDWENQPSLYKKYPGIDPLPLPEVDFGPGKNLFSLLRESRNDAHQHIGIKDLSLILHLTYTLTARARHGAEYFYYRSAASAGALYPTEIYVAAHSISGLDNGLYHFSSGDHSLSLIRENIQEGQIIRINQDQDDNTGTQGLAFFLTGIIFRSSWKYRDRAYRYNLLDTGHVVENLILALKATKTHFNLSCDFDDNDINHFLGLDGEREVAFAIIEIPGSFSRIECGLKNKEISKKVVRASRVSIKEINYPIISELHKAGYKIMSKIDYKEDMIHKSGLKSDRWENLGPASSYNEVMDYPEAVFRRRSSRNFIREAMKKDHIIDLIDSLCINDSLKNEGETAYLGSIITGFIAINIEKLEPGIYLVDRNRKSYGSVGQGFFREQIAHICLDQEWLANAAAHFFFLGNLDVIERSWGPRGYRYALITAGRMGQRLYLAATSIGIGCCGIGAFYDNEAMELLGLNKDSRLLYLLATGPAKLLFRK